MAKKLFFALASLAVFAFASATFAQDAIPGAPVKGDADAKKLDTDATEDVVDEPQKEDFEEGDCDGCKKAGDCKCEWKCVAVRGCFGCIKYRMVKVCDCKDCKCSCCKPCCVPCCKVRCCKPVCCKPVCCKPVCCKPCCVKVVRCCAPVCCVPCCKVRCCAPACCY